MLTDPACRNAACPADRPRVRLTDAGGLYLEIVPSGAKRWFYKYRFGDNMWYALASKGYRYGGVNEGPPQTTFKSDSLWNYETGVRLSPAAGVQLDLTAFLLDWTDAQFTYFEQRGQLAFSGIGNVGKARSTGPLLGAPKTVPVCWKAVLVL